MRALILLALLLGWSASGLAMAGDKPGADEVDSRIAHAEELVEKGDPKQAQQICESVLSMLPQGASTKLGRVLNVMSKVAAAQGDYKRAIDSAQHSADAFETGGDSDGQAHALNNKGIAEIQLGTYDIAEADLSKALALSQKANDAENQVQISNNLGSSRYFHGAYSEAESDYQRALNLIEANASAGWSDYWHQITRFNQATLYQRLGRYDRALRLYRDVESSSKDLSESDRGHVYANLGTLYRRLGDPYKALDSYRMAQSFYAKQHDADGELAVLKNSGIAYALDMQDLTHAATIFRSVLALAKKTGNRREEMQGHLYLGETLLRSNALAGARGEFEQTLVLANELNTSEEQWKASFGLGKVAALTGDSAGAERDYRKAIAVIEQSRGQLQISALRAEFFADKREVYDALLSMLFKKQDVSEAFLVLEKSRARNFQDRLAGKANPAASTLTLAQAQAALPAASAMLEFWTFENQIGLIWCTNNASGMSLQDLTPEQRAHIQAKLREIPAHFGDNADFLSELLPQSLILPQNIAHLLIVPDGWISYVPFDLLHEPHSNTELIESYDISYLPTAALLARKTQRSRYYPPWTNQLVAFGDPITAANGQQSAAADLPFSQKEIADIAGLAHGKAQAFLRAADLKYKFLGGTANDAFLLHVSTHAFADSDNPENSRLLFSPEQPGAGDSYVYLRELNGIDLSHVALATISACDTERGKMVRGEGVQAFSRALLAAGADASVTTLWRVDDQLTAQFMRQFYFYLLEEHQPKAEALRRAKLKFLKSNSRLSDPAVWAAFVLNGNGLTPIPRVLSWTEVSESALIFVAAMLLLALSIWQLRRGRS